MAKIALGTWAWGAGAVGGDKVFGSKTDVEVARLEALADATGIDTRGGWEHSME